MMISSRGRYCLRVMIDLAEHQGISLKYMEKLLPVLVKHNVVEGLQGKSGGYRLIRKPEEYTLGQILRLTEGSLAPVACLDCGAAPCDRADQCRTLPVWTELDRIVNQYLDSVTVADLLKSDISQEGTCP